MTKKLPSLLLLAIIACLVTTCAYAQSTAFTYQGQLRDTGTNANGTYPMVFRLFNAPNVGIQVGGDLNLSPTLVSGLFTVNLDFGASAFDGNARWLEINVAGETLTPRVQVLPVPYALLAAKVPTNSILTTNLQDGIITDVKVATNSTLIKGLDSGLLLVSGAVSSSGSIVQGQGFAVSSSSTIDTKTYNVTFSTPFSGLPSIALGVVGNSGKATLSFNSPSPNGFNVVNYFGTNGTASGFSFIAIGPK